jgi:hypothetical protein
MLIRMCDVALRKERTPCQMVSFPSPDQSPTDPACPRCSHAGQITVFISPSAPGRTSRDRSDRYNFKDVYAELHAQLAEAAESSLPSTPIPAPLDDRALVEALKDATGFVMVEHQDAEEQKLVVVERTDAEEELDEKGAPPPSLEIDEDVQKFLAHSPQSMEICKGFSLALGRLFFRN